MYGNILGTVADPSGAAVPNAVVIITDMNRGVVFTTTTNESGFFTQRFLIAGQYHVRVEAGGFRAHLQDVSVSVDQDTSLVVRLQLGEPERNGRGDRGDSAVEDRAQRRGDHVH